MPNHILPFEEWLILDEGGPEAGLGPAAPVAGFFGLVPPEAVRVAAVEAAVVVVAIVVVVVLVVDAAPVT